MPTPIQQMIDAACGVQPGDFVTLRCPGCKAEKRVRKDVTDPDGTAIVEFQCPDCNPGDFDIPTYFDENGIELLFEE
ncbi:hypothetical protein [Roseibium sp. Sym1]|uniref:hypothetical protein n=1 Tax=Roseibium sp. Sym1 TaxID=3016006 RepID=UPI0022B405C8|nr:hypothetical protein [Roseibium sp. Sym1]